MIKYCLLERQLEEKLKVGKLEEHQPFKQKMKFLQVGGGRRKDLNKIQEINLAEFDAALHG